MRSSEAAFAGEFGDRAEQGSETLLIVAGMLTHVSDEESLQVTIFDINLEIVVFPALSFCGVVGC